MVFRISKSSRSAGTGAGEGGFHYMSREVANKELKFGVAL